MKAILLDDEQLALHHLERQLLKLTDVEVKGKFVNPIIGKEAILHEDVDVVFMDIHMPEINGVNLAEQILQHKPQLPIVFVTAYPDYAVRAFELKSIDYIVKPVSEERLRKTIQRIENHIEAKAVTVAPSPSLMKLRLFRQVSILSSEQQLINLRWRTARVQEMFIYLLQHRGHLVRKSVLIELFWPEYDTSKVYSQLYTAIYHIRKTLAPYGEHFIIQNTFEGYILQVVNVNLDVEDWENRIHESTAITTETIDDYELLMELYTGDYLQEHDYWWAENERHRLKLLWNRTSHQMAEWYVQCSHQEKAVKKYLEICSRHPHAEEAHFALMKLYASSNNYLSVNRQYRLLTTVLLDDLYEQPSTYIVDWYNNWSQTTEEIAGYLPLGQALIR